MPFSSLRSVARHYREGEVRLDILSTPICSIYARRDGRSGRALRRRQIDAAAYRRTAGAAGRRRSADQERADVAHVRRRAHAAAPRHDRFRLSVPSSAAGILGAGECRAAADDQWPERERSAPAGATIARLSAARTARVASARRSFPAANSSASPSPAPSRTRRIFCSPTNRPAISIRARRSMFSGRLMSLARSTGLAALIATHNLELASQMDRRVTLRDGRCRAV